jgi:nicotinamidase-related amidase/MFS family permease
VSGPVKGTFRSFNSFNYRVWAGGAFVSNVGTWMQRTAQDWLVLTQLTHKNATAVGVVMALQFGPQLLLLPMTGFAADHLDRRKLLLATQVAMGALALGLGILTVAGLVQLWHVYVFAFLLGCVTAFDAPARQTFVSDLVGEADLSNAVALNSTSFNAARMIGPAVAGVLITTVGSGWVFLVNAASFAAVLCALGLLRVGELHLKSRALPTRGSLAEGFRYVWKRPDLKAVLLMLFLIGTFGLNFPIFISTMSVTVFHAGAGQYGLLTSIMAVGSVVGALLAARRVKPHIALLLAGAAIFGLGFALAAVMPSDWLFALALIVIGVSAQTFTTSTNSLVQLSTAPAMRGRVMAILLAIALGGTPIGAPIVGWVADTFGPRWALGIGAASGFAAAIVALHYLVKYRHLRMRIDPGRLRFNLDDGAPNDRCTMTDAHQSDHRVTEQEPVQPSAPKGKPMALTEIDNIAALVVIDMQKGIVALPTVHPAPEITDRVARLARAFRENGLPVVLVNVAGRAPGRTETTFNFSPPADWTELVPELDPQLSDHTVTKLQVGAFYGTALEQILRRRGVTQVFLAGISTSSGVEATARNAYDHGYNVVPVVDAMTDRDADAHRYSVDKVFPRIGETATTDQVLQLLKQPS